MSEASLVLGGEAASRKPPRPTRRRALAELQVAAGLAGDRVCTPRECSSRQGDCGALGCAPETPLLRTASGTSDDAGCAESVTPVPRCRSDVARDRPQAPRKRDVTHVAGAGPKGLVQAAVTRLRAVQNRTPTLARRPRSSSDAETGWQPNKVMRLLEDPGPSQSSASERGCSMGGGPGCLVDAMGGGGEMGGRQARCGPSSAVPGALRLNDAFSPGLDAMRGAQHPEGAGLLLAGVAGDGLMAPGVVPVDDVAIDKNAKRRLEDQLEEATDCVPTPSPSKGGRLDLGMEDVIARLDEWC